MTARLLDWKPAEWLVDAGWRATIDAFLRSPAGLQLGSFMEARLDEGAVIFPPHPFRALELTPLASVQAVVLGQDPYHGPGQAEGLAFSVPAGVKPPPSLRNIFQELGGQRATGSLADWAARGVLLLNSSLTVEQGSAGSHARTGWEQLTDAILEQVARTASPCVYLLWGAHAQAKTPLIERVAAEHDRDALILVANHPSPLSARRSPIPFIGCGHFAKARQWLAERGRPDIF